MPGTEPSLRNISDTALWAAVFRARETDRHDGLFRDPLARRLAGERGEKIVNTMPHANENEWAWIMRTYLFDRAIANQVREGVGVVVNLAAGLDARPYRMPLPPTLQWVEIDLPELFAYKDPIPSSEKPVCALERIPFDLTKAAARRDLFANLGRKAKRVLVISEGLLIYLSEEEVGRLAQDLAAAPNFARWVLDLASPGLLHMLQQTTGASTKEAGAPLKFGPKEGPEFFLTHGWTPAEVQSVLQAAIATKRLPKELEPFASIPESSGPQGEQPWSGVCLFSNQSRRN
jgi:methyltransferase (TIGR00027 family)